MRIKLFLASPGFKLLNVGESLMGYGIAETEMVLESKGVGGTWRGMDIVNVKHEFNGLKGGGGS